MVIEANAGQHVALDLVDGIAEDDLGGRIRVFPGGLQPVGDFEKPLGFLDFGHDLFCEAGFILRGRGND